MRGRVLTAEILIDDSCSDVDIAPAFEGLEIMRGITDLRDVQIDIVNAGRPIRINKQEDEYIRMDEVCLPKFSENLNIIVTNRRLQFNASNMSKQLLGMAYHRKLWRVSPYVFASAAEASTEELPRVVAHETTHAIVAPYTSLLDNHCRDDECLMYHAISEQRTEHCDPCAKHLAKSALRMCREQRVANLLGRKRFE